MQWQKSNINNKLAAVECHRIILYTQVEWSFKILKNAKQEL